MANPSTHPRSFQLLEDFGVAEKFTPFMSTLPVESIVKVDAKSTTTRIILRAYDRENGVGIKRTLHEYSFKVEVTATTPKLPKRTTLKDRLLALKNHVQYVFHSFFEFLYFEVVYHINVFFRFFFRENCGGNQVPGGEDQAKKSMRLRRVERTFEEVIREEVAREGSTI